MKIDKYEIDMLGVNDAETLLIHFHESEPNKGKEHIILIDAGNKSDGSTVLDFINNYYTTKTIDLAICTHCDEDHLGGFITILEEMKNNLKYKGFKINKFLLNSPVSWNSNQGKQLYSTDGGKSNLIDLLIESGIEVHRGFSDEMNWGNPFPDVITILSPSKAFYQSLQDKLSNQKDIKPVISERLRLFSSQNIDDISNDTSAANKTSIAVLFTPEPDCKYMFAAEMEEEAFDNMNDKLKMKCKNVKFLKMPHHGSAHNVNSKILNHYNPRIVFISATDGTLNKNKGIQNYFKNKNTVHVYSTHGTSNVCLRNGYPIRSNYIKAIPLWQEK